MTTKEMQEAILKWKKEQDCCILAHCYQTHDILEVADFVGDSFGLAQKAAQTNCKRVMMCGVRFMAETVKILSPEKQVYLPKAEAGYITNREELEEACSELFSLIASGVIKVDVAESQIYPLSEARRAHEVLESRVTQGSSLLLP